jgi:hypothetical protein
MNEDYEHAKVVSEEAEGFDCGYAWASNEASYEQIARFLPSRDDDWESEHEALGRGLALWRVVHGDRADYDRAHIELLAVRLVGAEYPSAALMRGFTRGVLQAHDEDGEDTA